MLLGVTVRAVAVETTTAISTNERIKRLIAKERKGKVNRA
jgi:hypothetical protein